jgi:hypothetical protein
MSHEMFVGNGGKKNGDIIGVNVNSEYKKVIKMVFSSHNRRELKHAKIQRTKTSTGGR